MLCVCCTTTCTQNPQQIGVRAKPPTNGQTVYSRGQWARERERGDTTDRADGDGGVNGAIASPIYNSQSHGHIQRQKASPARSVRQLSDGICYSKTTLASSDAPTHVRQKEKKLYCMPPRRAGIDRGITFSRSWCWATERATSIVTGCTSCRVKKTGFLKPNPVGFGGFGVLLVFLDKQEKVGKIIQKLYLT